MKAFYTTFNGLYPVGAAAVVVATTKKAAAELLKKELAKVNMAQKITPDQMVEIHIDKPMVHIVLNGDYS